MNLVEWYCDDCDRFFTDEADIRTCEECDSEDIMQVDDRDKEDIQQAKEDREYLKKITCAVNTGKLPNFLL